MKLCINSFPDPIIVRGDKPDDDVKLIHTYMTSFDRMRAIELMAVGISESMRFLYAYIKDWSNVIGPDGAPIPFGAKLQDQSGAEITALDCFLSRISLAQQIEIWVTQLVMNGVALKESIKPALRELLDQEGQARIEALIRPLSKKAGS